MGRIREGPTLATSKPDPAPLSQRQRSDIIYGATFDLGGRPSYLHSWLRPARPKVGEGGGLGKR
jgi:hypothetical protein